MAWLLFFVMSHVVLVLFPGDDPTGDGPWGRTAYVVFNVVLISMSAVGQPLLWLQPARGLSISLGGCS
ncbi:hypothetical protein ACFP2T_31275 [Plantactinospora solaniradicis]|uniref:Uncharacterized protein n=1 Tax=Plantactinospora solaniradicis TaxID=1723736 RepID=A0ABW1KFU8_9ACTN